MEREVLPVEREVLCDVWGDVEERREVMEEERDALSESGQDVSVVRDVLCEGRAVLFEERVIVAERRCGGAEPLEDRGVEWAAILEGFYVME